MMAFQLSVAAREKALRLKFLVDTIKKKRGGGRRERDQRVLNYNNKNEAYSRPSGGAVS